MPQKAKFDGFYLLSKAASLTTSRLKDEGQCSGSAGEALGSYVEGGHKPGAHSWGENTFAKGLEKVGSGGHVISQWGSSLFSKKGHELLSVSWNPGKSGEKGGKC